MPLHPNVRRCTHIQITGHRCGSPALKQEYFCYFHTRMIKGVQTRVDSQIHPVALIENAEAIQAAIMHMIDAVLKGTIDIKRANVVLKALHIAVRNSRNVYFHIRRDDMVREVPNYAEQYLTEHPELGPPITHVAPDAPVRGAEQSSPEDCHPEEAQAFAKRRPANEDCHPEEEQAFAKRSPAKEDCHPEEEQAFAKRGPANEGSLHPSADPAASPDKKSHPEGARKRDSKDPDTANRGAAASGNSLNPPEGNRKKTTTDDTPPLTSRQTELNQELKNLEACIEGAMRGDWRDLRTVFNTIGLTPPKPPTSQKSPPTRKSRNAKTV
jgi:hypothetical protein